MLHSISWYWRDFQILHSYAQGEVTCGTNWHHARNDIHDFSHKPKTTSQPSYVFYATGLSVSTTRGRRRVSVRLIMRHTIVTIRRPRSTCIGHIKDYELVMADEMSENKRGGGGRKRRKRITGQTGHMRGGPLRRNTPMGPVSAFGLCVCHSWLFL